MTELVCKSLKRWLKLASTDVSSVSQVYLLKLSADTMLIFKPGHNHFCTFLQFQEIIKDLRKQPQLCWHFNLLSWSAFLWLFYEEIFILGNRCMFGDFDWRSSGFRTMVGATSHRYADSVCVDSSRVWWNISGDTVSALPFGPDYK